MANFAECCGPGVGWLSTGCDRRRRWRARSNSRFLGPRARRPASSLNRAATEEILAAAGFASGSWTDVTEEAIAWFGAGRPPAPGGLSLATVPFHALHDGTRRRCAAACRPGNSAPRVERGRACPAAGISGAICGTQWQGCGARDRSRRRPSAGAGWSAGDHRRPARRRRIAAADHALHDLADDDRSGRHRDAMRVGYPREARLYVSSIGYLDPQQTICRDVRPTKTTTYVARAVGQGGQSAVRTSTVIVRAPEDLGDHS